jgi:hypothetical protein
MQFFSKEVKEITLTCSKQVFFSNSSTPKTTNQSWHRFLHNNGRNIGPSMVFNWYKVFKVGRRNFLIYEATISISKECPTYLPLNSNP